MPSEQLVLPEWNAHRVAHDAPYRFAPPNELAGLRFEYAQMSPAERRTPAVREQWRVYFENDVRKNRRAAPRLWRHARTHRKQHDRAREASGIEELLPVIAQHFPTRKADALTNLAAVAAELTYYSALPLRYLSADYSRQKESKKTEWVSTGHSASIEVMATRLGLSVRTVQRALRTLTAIGLITCTEQRPDGKRQRANTYTISPTIWRVMAKIDVIARRTRAKEARALKTLHDHPRPILHEEREKTRPRILAGFAELKRTLKTKSVTPSPILDNKLSRNRDNVGATPRQTSPPVVRRTQNRLSKGAMWRPPDNKLDYFAKRLWRKGGEDYARFRGYVRHWLAAGHRPVAIENAVWRARDRDAQSLSYASAILRQWNDLVN